MELNESVLCQRLSRGSFLLVASRGETELGEYESPSLSLGGRALLEERKRI